MQSKIDKMEEFYHSTKSKSEQKEMLADIEEFDKESQYSEVLKEATSFACNIESRIAYAKSELQKVQLRLRIPASHPGASQLNDGDSNFINDQGSSATQLTRGSRSVRVPSVKLPEFNGNPEEFPEYWAVFETLVHDNSEISTIEKIALLKESLKGPAEKVIRGIKPIPDNYQWMVDTVTKRFGNKPTNRSTIVQKLFDLRPASKQGHSCQECFDTIKTLVNQMVSAGYDIRDTCDPMWSETILQKFPYEIVRDILVKNQSTDTLKIEELLDALEKEICAKAYVEQRLGSTYSYKERDNRAQRHCQSVLCIFCGKTNHNSMVCRTMTDRQQRRAVLKEKRACWKCFQTNHSSSHCQKSNCTTCGSTHHPSVCTAQDRSRQIPGILNPPQTNRWPRNDNHNGNINNRAAQRPQIPNRERTSAGIDSRRNHSSGNQPLYSNQNTGNEVTFPDLSNRSEQLVLMTAEGNVWNNKDSSLEKVLFFFDTGAQKTVIQESLAERLGLPKTTTETCIMSGIGGYTEKFESHIVSLKVCTAHGKEINLAIQTKPIITGGFPSVKLAEIDQEFLQNEGIFIANSKVRGERQLPHILVGLDRYYDLVVSNTTDTRTPSGLHIAKTVFGPTIYGRGIMDTTDSTAMSHSMTSVLEISDSDNIQRMFELESLGIEPMENTKDDSAFKYFEEYSSLITFANGYITAPFPLKDSVSDLSDNYGVAVKRLAALQKQLQANTAQQQWYSKILSDYESQGVIERTYDLDTNAVGKYYMPHSGVWRETKKTPLRIVFDASSKKRGEQSLNDVIYKGESFVNKIHDILIASRLSKFVLLCDIEAAFTQIRIPAHHKDLCRFLWVKQPSLPLTQGNIVEYRFTRLPFGVTASPSILNMAIFAYLQSQKCSLATEIASNLYVDNILLVANTVEETLQKYELSKALFARIGMNLREYVSNSELVNARIPSYDRLPSGSITYLGVDYDTITDRFTVKATFPLKQDPTKRDIVSQLNSIYDPLGIISPLLIHLKSTMREILSSNLDWNSRVPHELRDKWNRQCSEVNNTVLSVPRLLSPFLATNNSRTARLWVFADASKVAISACAFIQSQEGDTVSQIMCGKSRLTPKKNEQTIPRLELLGILIAMRLAVSIEKAVNTKIATVNVVTDSEVALCWIKSSRKLPVFVANQCMRIRKLKGQLETNNVMVQFYHVPTAYNPADAGTRGLSNEQILDHSWLQGPRWLEGELKSKLLKPIDVIQSRGSDEECDRPVIISLPHASSTHTVEHVFDLSRFSRLSTALRSIARVGKFLHHLISKVNEKRQSPLLIGVIAKFGLQTEIDANDMNFAATLLHADVHRNINEKELSNRFRNMQIVRDKYGVIRHISRMQHACIPADSKSPIYLPNRGDATRLVLTAIHNDNFHCGKDQTLSLARQKYWIPRASGSFKTYLRNCTVCKRWQGLPFGPPLCHRYRQIGW